MDTYPSATSSHTAPGSRSSGSPKPPPPADGRVKVSPLFTGTLENTAPRNSSLSHTPCGNDGRPPSIPHVTERARSQQYDITVLRTSVRRPPFCTPQPPRQRPGPPVSGRISWPVVTTGERRSWPSSGWTASPTPNTGEVALEPSLPLRPPQPPAIQSYHMKIESPPPRVSVPPTSRYSRLNDAAIARSGMTCDHSSKIAFMILSHGPEQNPVTAVGQAALTQLPSGPRSTSSAR